MFEVKACWFLQWQILRAAPGGQLLWVMFYGGCTLLTLHDPA